MKAVFEIILSTLVLAPTLCVSQTKSITYEVGPIKDDPKKLQNLFNAVKEAGAEARWNNSSVPVAQHLGGRKYRVDLTPRNAPFYVEPRNIVVEVAEGTPLLADGERIPGFLFKTGRKHEGTTVLGAKVVLEIYELAPTSIATRSLRDFLRVLSLGYRGGYSCTLPTKKSVKCGRCDGWGKTSALRNRRGGTGRRACSTCGGEGELRVVYQVRWGKKAP